MEQDADAVLELFVLVLFALDPDDIETPCRWLKNSKRNLSCRLAVGSNRPKARHWPDWHNHGFVSERTSQISSVTRLVRRDMVRVEVPARYGNASTSA